MHGCRDRDVAGGWTKGARATRRKNFKQARVVEIETSLAGGQKELALPGGRILHMHGCRDRDVAGGGRTKGARATRRKNFKQARVVEIERLLAGGQGARATRRKNFLHAQVVEIERLLAGGQGARATKRKNFLHAQVVEIERLLAGGQGARATRRKNFTQARVVEIERLLADGQKELALPGGFKPATPKSLACPWNTRLQKQPATPTSELLNTTDSPVF